MTESPIVEAQELVKRYGDHTALDGLDLSVPEGTVLALLGPNGAGKTTAVSILATLLRADSGIARVAGHDVSTEPVEVRRRIGLSGQYAAVDEYLTGFENLEMVGRLYHLGKRRSRDRADELLERFSLTDAGHRTAGTYSGGMRRRLDLAAALVAAPPVIFLDEPTTGLDPRSRLDLWSTIAELVTNGSTVLLTTQYMEEAEQLADDIVVIDHGREIAHGTADELKTIVGGERIEIVVNDPADLGAAEQALKSWAVGEVHIDGRSVNAPVIGGANTLREVLTDLSTRSINLLDVGLRRPTLDDVFLTLTGSAPAEDTTEETNGDSAPPAEERELEVAR